MQHLKEFLTRIQTFDLGVIEEDIHMKWGTNEKKHVRVYDLTYQTPYYDSFSYRSELRVLKDMAFIDLMILDKERIQIQLAELAKVRNRFKEFWKNYHDLYSEMTRVYNRSFIFSVRLEYLFIVNGLQPASAEIEISGKFAEDLGDSVKLREKFLMELISDAETAIKPKQTEAEFREWLNAEQKKRQAEKAENSPVIGTADQGQSEAVVTKAAAISELNEAKAAAAKIAGYYPIFKTGAAEQIFSLLREYFVAEEHPALEKLLLNDEAPASPLLFRGPANQLADAFKQFFQANLIVGCKKKYLQKWMVPKFLYLSQQSEPRELSEGYLSGLMSENTRPCKSPILKIEYKEDQFFILPIPRNK